jgi:hypothetical protein
MLPALMLLLMLMPLTLMLMFLTLMLLTPLLEWPKRMLQITASELLPLLLLLLLLPLLLLLSLLLLLPLLLLLLLLLLLELPPPLQRARGTIGDHGNEAVKLLLSPPSTVSMVTQLFEPVWTSVW